jgi:sugar/nucleoside kinase (ribokinase family)
MMRPAHLDELRTLMQSVTAFLPNQDEVRSLLWGRTNDLWEMAEAIADLGCEIVVIKCGARGQLLYEAPSRKRWEVPAYPARVADPSGAGDAFCGGFLAGYRRTYDPLQAVMYGNVSASLTVEGSGPFYALSVLHGLADARLKVLRDIVREV